MKNNIIVKNTSRQNIEKSVLDMANLYADTEFVYPIEIYSSTENQNTFLVKFPNIPDFDRFCYFVNYLEFPMDFQDYHPQVFGIWELQKKINDTHFEIGETIGLYISKKDDEHDNVYLINSKKNVYKYAFYNKIFDVNFLEYNYEEIVKSIGSTEFHKKISPSKEVVNKLNKPWWKFW